MIDTLESPPEMTPEELMRTRIARIYSEQLWAIKNDMSVDIKATTEAAIQTILETFPDENKKEDYFWRPTQLADLVYGYAKERKEKGGIPGLDTGFPTLNKLFGGFISKEIYGIIARSGTGKTTILTQLALKLSRQTNTVFFSPEARAQNIGLKMASALCGVPFMAILNGEISDGQLDAIKASTEAINKHSIYIYDMPSINAFEMNRIIDKVERETGQKTGAIIVDYLQQMEGEETYIDISRNMKDLEILTVKRDVTCILTSQANRASNDGSGLGASRGSGKAEDLMAAQLSLIRPEPTKDNPNPDQNVRHLVCSKNRYSGVTFKLDLRYNPIRGLYDEDGQS